MSPMSTSRVLQILCRTVSVTSSSRRRRVMVFGAIPAALRRSALLIFLSTRSFQSLLYEIAISFDLRLEISTSLYTLFGTKAREFRILLRNSLFLNSPFLFEPSRGNVQIIFESESPKFLLHRMSPSEQKPPYRNNTFELTEQYKVDFHHNFVINFVIKVNSIRAWDYPKIAVCTDTGCACYSLKSHWSTEVVLAFQSGLWYTVVGRMKT